MNALRRLLPYIRPYRRRLLLALAATSLFTLLSLLPPLLLRALVNRVIEPQDYTLLPWLVLGLALAPVLAFAIRFFNTRAIMLTSLRFISDMRKRMYSQVLHLSLRYHGDHSSGMLVSRIMDDINMLQRLLTTETVQIIVDLIVFVFSVGVVFSLSPQMGALLSVLLLTYVAVYRYYADRIRIATEAYRGVYDQIAGRLQETVAGVRQVRIFNREASEDELFRTRNEYSLQKSLESKMSSVKLSNACMMVAGYGSTIICGLGAILVIRQQMTYGDLHAINVYVWMAINPAVRLTGMIGQLNETFVSIDRILEVLESDDAVPDDPSLPAMPRGRGMVELRDVTFAYKPETPLYQGLSLTVEPGRTVALVGPTGCGKTTLTKLLMRQWDAQGGQVLIDGIDVRSVRLRSLRQLFGVVLQDPRIFDATFAENVAYGNPHAARESIEAAARAAELGDLLDRMPEGLETMLGTFGTKLSVGEKQRLSIARAILQDPLILIMDEATSALDSESEALVQKALERVLTGRTSFIVAHRLSTIVGADMIVVMRDGAIIEQGTHAELLRIENGFYRQLYEELRGRQEVGT